MKHLAGPEAVALILSATTAEELFGPRADDNASRRKVTRQYRVLAFAVHPDRAAIEGISVQDAEAATRLLTERFETHQSNQTKPTGTSAAAPRVGDFMLGKKVRTTDTISTYATAETQVFVDIRRTAGGEPDAQPLVTAAKHLAAADMGVYGPEVIEFGETAGHLWTAYRLPEGLHSLRAVLAAYPEGLNGRDWAWMARRIYMTLDAAEQPHGGLTLDTVLIHPEHHGVVLTGWVVAATSDGPDIHALFDRVLRRDETRQRDFALASMSLTPEHALREYDLLLRAMYGERRFRPFSVPRAA